MQALGGGILGAMMVDNVPSYRKDIWALEECYCTLTLKTDWHRPCPYAQVHTWDEDPAGDRRLREEIRRL